MRTCAIGIVLAAAIVLQSAIALAATDRTVSVAATAAKPMTPGAVLDDFRYAAPINLWSVGTGTFSSSIPASPPDEQICGIKYINDANAYSGYSLELDYNVTATNGYAGYYSRMRLGPTGGSLSGYTAVSFYVKGAVGGEFFKVALKNTSTAQHTFTTWDNQTIHYSRNESAVYITDYLDGGVTTGWKKVTIPMHNFANLDTWDSMAEFVIVFENSQSVSNSSPTSGIVYIDNITFETTDVTTVRVDHFGDKIGVSALGGIVNTTADSGAVSCDYSNAPGEYYGYPNSMRLSYDVENPNSWAAVYFILGGGNNVVEDLNMGGWIPVPQNFNAYSKLTFRIKARSADENPVYIRVEVVCANGTKIGVLGGITTDWKYAVVPLDQLMDSITANFDIDKTSIRQITFVFENYWTSQSGAHNIGSVFIDAIQFE